MNGQLSMLDDLAGENPKMPSEPIVREAEFSRCGTYRWTLKRAWGKGPMVLWCGLNPSLADTTKDDPTIRREIGFSYRWGFGSMVKVNMYPIISPQPSDMLAWRKTWDEKAYWENGSHPDDLSPYGAWQYNIRTINHLIAEDAVCIAAWGNHASQDLDYFLQNVTRNVDTSEHDGFGDVGIPIDWQCLGTNGNGSPRHTLSRGRNRVPDDTKAVAWRKVA